MKTILFALSLLLVSAVALPAAETSPVYELRTYTAMPGRLNDVLARFRDHTLAIFAKHGMTSVGYWVPEDAKDGAGGKLVYMLRFPSRAAAVKLWAEFRADPEWQSVQKASETHGKIVAKAESVFLDATPLSPMH